MSWNPLDWLKPAGDLVDSIGDAIDKNITSDEERLILKNELVQLKTSFQVKMSELEGEAEKERTKRWESDNKDGSALSRNVRPLSLVYLLFVISALALTDGNYGEFTIKLGWVELFTVLATTAFGGYFLSRGYEKSKGVTK